MKLKNIVDKLQGQIVCEEDSLDQIILHAYASNVETDIMKVKGYNPLLITNRIDTEIINIATKAELNYVLIVKCKTLPQELSQAAKEHNIALICCEQSMFMAVATLSDAGMLPVYPQ